MIKSCLKQNIPMLLLAGIILCLSVYMLYWGTQKDGYHIDEMFSMMDIRGRDIKRPYTDDSFFNTWHTASDLESTIGVTAENAFSGVDKYENLHWNLLHIAYSFSPGGFTVWPSIVLNILIFIGSSIIIYLLSRLFIQNDYLALLPVLGWGVSSAAVNLVLFIRFYSLKTFICLLLTHLVFIAVKSGFNKWRYPVCIAVVTFTGAYVHDFFLAFAFYLSVFICFYLFMKKQFKPLFKFAGAMILPVVCYQLISGTVTNVVSIVRTGTPAEIDAGTADASVTEAIMNVTEGSAGFSERVQSYSGIISEAVFGGAGIYVLLPVFLIPAGVLYCVYRSRGYSVCNLLKKQTAVFWLIVAGVCLMYVLTIARIAPYQEIRYVFCITPFCIILFISLLIKALSAIGFTATGAVFAPVAVLCLLLPAGNVRSFNLHWGVEKTNEELKAYHRLPVVCIGNEPWEVASCYRQLFEFEDMVLFAAADAIDYDVLGERPLDEGLVVLLWHDVDVSVLDDIAEGAGVDGYEYVTDLVRHRVYCFW